MTEKMTVQTHVRRLFENMAAYKRGEIDHPAIAPVCWPLFEKMDTFEKHLLINIQLSESTEGYRVRLLFSIYNPVYNLHLIKEAIERSVLGEYPSFVVESEVRTDRMFVNIRFMDGSIEKVEECMDFLSYRLPVTMAELSLANISKQKEEPAAASPEVKKEVATVDVPKAVVKMNVEVVRPKEKQKGLDLTAARPIFFGSKLTLKEKDGEMMVVYKNPIVNTISKILNKVGMYD